MPAVPIVMPRIESMSPQKWGECYRMRQSIYDLCATPTDRRLAELAVQALYENAGKKKPKVFFAKSPLEGVLLVEALRANLEANLRDNLRANLEDNLEANLWANLEANLWANLEDNLEANLWDNLRANLRANLEDNLWANLEANLWDNLRANLWDNLWANLEANLRDNLWDNLCDLYWAKAQLGFLKGGEIAGVEYDPQRWKTYKLISENLDVIFPFEGFCIVCDRPTKIGWHDAGGIHCEDGPAVLYADGYCLWAIEGYLVPESVVMTPHLQTVEEINMEQNEEVKRIRINRFGWNRLVSESGAEVLDVAMPRYGGMESLLQCGDYTVLFTYDPSTGRPYALEVDPDCKTCEAAQRYLLAPDAAFGRHGVDVSKIETYPPIRA